MPEGEGRTGVDPRFVRSGDGCAVAVLQPGVGSGKAVEVRDEARMRQHQGDYTRHDQSQGDDADDNRLSAKGATPPTNVDRRTEDEAGRSDTPDPPLVRA